MNTFRRFSALIRGLTRNSRLDIVERAIADVREIASGNRTDDELNELWRLQAALFAHQHYLKGFSHLLDGDFFLGWYEFERSEILLLFLYRHLRDRWEFFHLDFIQKAISRWQSLFPYRWFGSPGIIDQEIVCSICLKTLTPRQRCPHRIGGLYSGFIAFRLILNWKADHLAILQSPLQKYSVLFPRAADGTKVDSFDYSAVDYAAQILVRPYEPWACRQTETFHPLHLYKAAIEKTHSLCPCHSGKQYRHCCRGLPGIRGKHLQILSRAFTDLPAYKPPARLPGPYEGSTGPEGLNLNIIPLRLNEVERDGRILTDGCAVKEILENNAVSCKDAT